ncbi:hypothetical protein PMAYCL1PPCAC_23845 [Pristionchus mayeri]|uniref:Uncharacterized protein n=1 Tax=Pristionchus mayeri TaxID=1317129 RepID=A0AAN5D0N9_9BILA|nr:hypothetical protein PMAYCL1PPCAC_23845 [Pristionchus mayeri]
MISIEMSSVFTSSLNLVYTFLAATLLLLSSFNNDEPWLSSLALLSFGLLIINALLHYRSTTEERTLVQRKLNSWISNLERNKQKLNCIRINKRGEPEEVHFTDLTTGDVVLRDDRLSFIFDHISDREFTENQKIRISESFILFLRRSLNKKRIKSSTIESLSTIIKKMDIILVPIVLISTIFGLIIAYIFSEPEDNYANERFDVGVCVVVLLPLLRLILPLFSFLTFYCDNIAIQYMIIDDKSICSFFRKAKWKDLLSEGGWRSAALRMSDVSGVCAIDKKGILSTSETVLEKIFLMTSEDELGTMGEVLHLSCSIHESTITSFSFDDVNWHRFIGSLCPMVESVGVNGCVDKEGGHCLCPLSQLIPSLPKKEYDKESIVTFRIPREGGGNGVRIQAQGAVIRDEGMSRIHVRGSPSLLLPRCSTYWDGNQVKLMTDRAKAVASDFASRHSITSECVAITCGSVFEGRFPLATESQWIEGGRKMNRVSSTVSEFELHGNGREMDDIPQTFLGLAASQEQGLPLVFEMIESLQSSCIRFILFSRENQLRTRIIGEKLGLEAGWNCHISLKSDSSRREVLGWKRGRRSSCREGKPLDSYQSSIPHLPPNMARLPTGIDQIRPHLEDVDNVPLLVSLFTDCTLDSTRQMIDILHEYHECELILGSVSQQENLVTLMKGVFSIGVSPLSVSSCTRQGIPEREEAIASLSTDLIIEQSQISHLPRTLSFSRQRSSHFKQSISFYLISSFSISLHYLISVLLFLPFPISALNTIVLIFMILPLLTLSISSHYDGMTRLAFPSSPSPSNESTQFFFYHMPHLVTLTMTHYLLFSLSGLATCPLPFLCQSVTPFTSQRDLNQMGSIISFLRVTSTILTSTPYIFPYASSLRRIPPLSAIWSVVVVLSLSIQIYSSHTHFLTSIPPSLIVFYITLSSISLVIAQSYKRANIRIFKKENMRRKFGFDTKLGMNSPY